MTERTKGQAIALAYARKVGNALTRDGDADWRTAWDALATEIDDALAEVRREVVQHVVDIVRPWTVVGEAIGYDDILVRVRALGAALRITRAAAAAPPRPG